MNDLSVKSYRKAPSSSPLIRKDKIKTVVHIFVFLCLISGLAVLTVKISGLQKQAVQIEQGVYRTDDEMVNGGKRFVDYFYSLNSATVSYDQFRALNMIVNKEMNEKRFEYLKKEDFNRRVRDAKIKSEIDWGKTKVEIDHEAPEYFTVGYKGFIRLGSEKLVPFHIILELVPIKKDDTFIDGVGVWNLIDIANNPFEVSND